MRRMRITISVAALLLLCAANANAAPAIEGTVLFGGAAPAPKKIDVTIDQYVCGSAKDARDLLVSPRRELQNAVVWIDNPPPEKTAPVNAGKVAIDQQGCVFMPRIVIVPAGGTVDFLNSDRLLHNIHATPKLNVSFNRTQPKDRTIPVTFAKPEIIRINCDLHSWMIAWVVVAAHHWYAITGANGQFSFDGLPTGKYRLNVWHERLGTTQTTVTVGAQQPARVSVELKPR